MKNQDVPKGKKLNKKQLRSITGGLMDCIDPMTGGCRKISIGCAQLQCRPIIDPL
ncbi:MULTISPECIES: bacteriocin [Chryseobacterium]|uniref:Bacteriocin n=2 Tax=Chryseobacterium TaxID=59732 RepID=A0ABW9JY83_9FLAO|nr:MULTISPECIES: bacteriocin [Chryseobacterium]MBL1220689.1 bacteriocin [Chryseobacterium endalhagicum]